MSDTRNHGKIGEYLWFAGILLTILLASAAQVAIKGYAASNAAPDSPPGASQ